MKRTVFLALALFALMAVGLYAQTEADFEVRLFVNNTQVMIDNYKGNATTVNIPAKIKNLPVFSIGSSAFADNKKITSVVIPNGVTEILDRAFSGCTNLTSVTFGGSIPESSFENKAFPGDIRAKYLAAGGGAGTYTRPSGGTTWTKGATAAAETTEADFTVEKSADGKSITITKYKGKATTVNIPAKIQNLPVTSIGNGAFAATNITSIVIPNSVTSIGTMVFQGSLGLTSVTFAGSIPSSGFNALAFKDFGDIRDKYLAGGAGTYTRPDNKSTTWTKK